MKTLNRYKLGLALLGLLVIGLLGVVLMQAGDTKQDSKTYEKADDIALKLESYVNDKKKVPNTLAEAKITDVPPSITYKKLSDESYKFCATYKAKSAGFNSSSTVVEDAIYQGMTGGAVPPDSLIDDTYSASGDTSYLYISPEHKKGENCQTIKPYIYQNTDSYDTDNYDDADSGDVTKLSDPKESSEASGNQDTVCYQSGFVTHYSGTVTSVATTDGKPIVPSTTQNLIIKVMPSAANTDAGAPKTEQTITVTATSHNIYNSFCTAIAHESVKSGDYISVFTGDKTPYSLDAMVDFSRNQ